MSSAKIRKQKKLDFLNIHKNAIELYDTMTEYLKLIDKYQELLDAKRLRILAEESLKTNENDYEEAYNYFSAALKLMRAYYNL